MLLLDETRKDFFFRRLVICMRLVVFVPIVFRFVLGSRRIAARYDCALTEKKSQSERRHTKTNPRGPRAAFHLSSPLMITNFSRDNEKVTLPVKRPKPRLDSATFRRLIMLPRHVTPRDSSKFFFSRSAPFELHFCDFHSKSPKA